MADYIPAGDAQFHAWQNNFIVYVNNHLADLGLDPLVVDIPPLTAAQSKLMTDGVRLPECT